jgi:hypothetical protein
MKRLITILVAGAVLTGCASRATTMQTAMNTCQQAGFQPGTELYLKCINNQNKPSFLEQYMLKRAANPGYDSGPTTTNCMRTGNMVQCNSY